MPLPARRWIPFLIIPLLGGSLLWLSTRPAPETDDLAVPVKRGALQVLVTAPGELRARRFVQIKGPRRAMRAEAFQMQIATLVPEGTVVRKGDVVATLDRAALAPRLQEVTVAVQKAEAQLTSAELDTALTLSQAREEIRNLGLSLEEKRLAKEQAVFEAPSVRRQAELDYERTERELAQARKSYTTKREQAIAKTGEVAAELRRQRDRLDSMREVLDEFTIRAPAPGMVIYVREWNGRKRGVGSQVNPWEPTIATLPDLSEMESVTYVNEIDVGKVAVGQPVRISLDANPAKRLTGKVTAVANVGEQRPNTDAKVFEVTVLVEGSDTTLRPGMTTSNAIETATVENALSIPIEAVRMHGDLPFVYKRTAGLVVRQEIDPGLTNDDEIVIRRGLAEGDEVLLTEPPDGPDLELVRLPGAGSE